MLTQSYLQPIKITSIWGVDVYAGEAHTDGTTTRTGHSEGGLDIAAEKGIYQAKIQFNPLRPSDVYIRH